MRYVYPYKTGSKSARQVAEAMGAPRVRVDIEIMTPNPNYTVINWGSGDLPAAIRGCRVINKAEAVNRAVNKQRTFEALKAANVPTPDWTSDRAVAQGWADQGTPLVARTKLEGKDGDGIILLKELRTDWFGRTLTLPDAKIYTKFIQAREEYRVNVCTGRTVGVQKKVPIGNNPNNDIKTGGNGYGFHLLAESEIPHGIRPVARAAVAALGLDFGGVDLIVGVDGNAYVLEVNTAPELTPSMVAGYAARLQNA